MPRPKAETARCHGARAVLLVSCPNSPPVQKPIGSLMHGPGAQPDLPQFHIDVAVADQMLAEVGVTFADLQAAIDSTPRPQSLPLLGKVRLRVRARYAQMRPTMNMVALVAGSDSLLSKECVLIGAHLDHVGRQSPSVYLPGANDNASGSAAVMAIAKAFVEAPSPLRRSVVFALLASEEQGMLGAEAYASRQPFPLGQTVAMLNLDCIGTGDSIQVYGGADFLALFAVAEEQDRRYTRLLSACTGSGGGADAGPFHRRWYLTSTLRPVTGTSTCICLPRRRRPCGRTFSLPLRSWPIALPAPWPTERKLDITRKGPIHDFTGTTVDSAGPRHPGSAPGDAPRLDAVLS